MEDGNGGDDDSWNVEVVDYWIVLLRFEQYSQECIMGAVKQLNLFRNYISLQVLHHLLGLKPSREQGNGNRALDWSLVQLARFNV